MAVVFDVGGVLEVTPELGVIERWAARLGLSAQTLTDKTSDIWSAADVGTISEPAMHTALGTRLSLSETDVATLMGQLWEQYLGTPNTELIEYARVLRSRYRTGILSNSAVGAREREQAAYGLTDLVDVVIYSHEVGIAKPDPRIYELTCQRLGVRPMDVIFLDDVEECVAGARQSGITAIHYRDNRQAITDIENALADQ